MKFVKQAIVQTDRSKIFRVISLTFLNIWYYNILHICIKYCFEYHNWNLIPFWFKIIHHGKYFSIFSYFSPLFFMELIEWISYVWISYIISIIITKFHYINYSKTFLTLINYCICGMNEAFSCKSIIML